MEHTVNSLTISQMKMYHLNGTYLLQWNFSGTKQEQSCAIVKITSFQYEGIGATLKTLIAEIVPAQLFIPRSLETVNTYLNRKIP